jgi:predicted RNA polymerase sigma factor
MLGSKPDVPDSHFVVEQAARDSYARLLAFLVARSRDVAAAEDALAEAFRTALETWPRTGIPAKPEAWLLVAARRKLIDAARRARTHEEAVPDLTAVTQEAYVLAETSVVFPDERLELLFLCAHPAIEDSVRTPLMLQTVLGLDAARIASAFLVKPSAMGQRLARAKAKIRTARMRFDLPQASELPGRLESVLEAIYAAYGSGWDDVAGADQRRKGLAAEAISLARLVVQLMPSEPEAKGLLALLLHCEARRDARRSADGTYLPLSEQDIAKWSMKMIDEAEAFLVDASRSGRPGRFQFEAAIQSAHAQRARTGRTDWPAVALLYDGLTQFWPTTGALVARAAAIAEARGAQAGWEQLEAISADRGKSYQPYWALAAHLLGRLGRKAEAETAYTRAIGLCEESAMRQFLRKQMDNLKNR